MARNNYQSDKRQRELRKKAKKQEKEQRKAERGTTTEGSTESDAPTTDESVPQVPQA